MNFDRVKNYSRFVNVMNLFMLLILLLSGFNCNRSKSVIDVSEIIGTWSLNDDSSQGIIVSQESNKTLITEIEFEENHIAVFTNPTFIEVITSDSVTLIGISGQETYLLRINEKKLLLGNKIYVKKITLLSRTQGMDFLGL